MPSSEAPDAPEDPTREKLLRLLKEHGWNATSFQILEPGYRYFVVGDDACVAYVDTGSAWVAAGAPIAAPSALEAVAQRFAESAKKSQRRVCFFATEPRFTQSTPGLTSLCIGEQPVWEPMRWSEGVRKSRSLREQLRRARSKGVKVRTVAPQELEDPQAPLRQEIDALGQRWLGARQMAPMGFLVQLSLFTDASERRCLIAELGGQLVGVLGMIPVYARGGWFCEDFLRAPDAPNGTVELLIDAAMQQAAAEGSQYITLGLAPLAGSLPVPLQMARRWGGALYDFEGLRAFKAKLQPHEWVPISLTYPKGQSGVLTTLDVLTAFARGGLLRFGIETLLRGPAVVVRVLAALLLPWTLLLALAPASYFPAAWVKWAWVAFDMGLAAALLRLTYAWRPWLATLLCVLVTGDAAVTLLEALLYNLPRAGGLWDVGVAAAAVAGPSLSAFLLWRGRMHRQTQITPSPSS